jgi:uncharacterized protein YjhX (UPF0386 family)
MQFPHAAPRVPTQRCVQHVCIFPDEAVKSWRLLSEKEGRYRVSVILYRQGERANTPTLQGEPFIEPTEHIEVVGSQPCYDSEGDDIGAKRKPYRKLSQPDSLIARIEKIGRWTRRNLKFLETTKELAQATRIRNNRANRRLEEVICFPDEACYRPGMTPAQHESEKQLWIQRGRNGDAYRAHRVANPYPADWPPETPPNQETPTPHP